MKQVAVIFSCGVPPNVIPSFLTKTGTVGEYLIIYQPSLLQLLGVFLYLQASEGKAAEVPRPSLRLGLSGFGSMRSPRQERKAEPGTVPGPGTGQVPGSQLCSQRRAPFSGQTPLWVPSAPVRWARGRRNGLGGEACPLGVPVVHNQ